MTKKEINELDDLWRNLVKSKANYVCEHCGIKGVRMEAAHVVGRRHRGTRWGAYLDCAIGEPSGLWVSGVTYDLCGHCFCHSCHQHYDEHGPLEDEIILKTVGVERKRIIQQIAREVRAIKQNYEDIYKILTELN